MARRILLLSSSTVSGSGYLDYAETELRDFLGRTRKVLFVPYAIHDRESYTDRVRERLAPMGYEVEGLTHDSSAGAVVERAEAIFVGGGNTFRLLKTLYDLDLLDAIRSRVAAGIPYIGSSAGSNVAGPTIRTTNDPSSTHMGETREERILQYLEENDTPVIGLREGAWLRVEGDRCQLGGTKGARWFERGREAAELAPGASVPCAR